MLDESVHDAYCVVTAQSQQGPSVVTYVSITMLANHTFLCPSIVSNVCIEVSQKDSAFVRFSSSQGITDFF